MSLKVGRKGSYRYGTICDRLTHLLHNCKDEDVTGWYLFSLVEWAAPLSSDWPTHLLPQFSILIGWRQQRQTALWLVDSPPWRQGWGCQSYRYLFSLVEWAAPLSSDWSTHLLHGGRDEDVALLEEQVLSLIGHGPRESLDCPVFDLGSWGGSKN